MPPARSARPVTAVPQRTSTPAAAWRAATVVRDAGGHGPAHEPVGELQHRDVRAERRRGGGQLQPDEPAADDPDAGARAEAGTQGLRVGVRADEVHRRAVERQRAGRGAGGEQQLGVGQRAAVVERHRVGVRIEGGRVRARQVGHVRGPQAFVVADRLVRPGLGERRALVGELRLAADERDRAGPPVLAQRERGPRAALARADDHHPRLLRRWLAHGSSM